MQDRKRQDRYDNNQLNILVGLLVNFGKRKVEYHPDHPAACDHAYPVNIWAIQGDTFGISVTYVTDRTW